MMFAVIINALLYRDKKISFRDSILLYPILFCYILQYSNLFHFYFILLYSILFCSILF